jgi:nicotinamide riboside kinase
MAELPETLVGDHPVQLVLRQEIWGRLNERNQHFMAVLVGPEGSGKSYTSLKIAELVDPTFTAERVMFNPADFLEQLQEWKAAGETKGKMVVVDEAGVGIGTRSWYEKDQIKLNKVLQVIRDENMGIIFTVPSLKDLDSQARRRLRAYCEMVNLQEGKYADMKFLRWLPKRDDKNKTYRKYPVVRVNGDHRKIRRLRFAPPTPELSRAYNQRKATFQAQLYDEAESEFRGDDDQISEQDIADKIIDNGIEQYKAVANGNGIEYIDSDLIQLDYETSGRKAKRVQKLLERYEKQQSQSDTTDADAHARA